MTYIPITCYTQNPGCSSVSQNILLAYAWESRNVDGFLKLLALPSTCEPSICGLQNADFFLICRGRVGRNSFYPMDLMSSVKEPLTIDIVR